jgi:hypothetical protein
MNENISIQDSGDVTTLRKEDIEKASEWEDFISLWTTSQEIDHKNQWCKGDIVNRVSVVHGEQSLIKFAEEVHESSTLMDHYRRVARAYPDDAMRNWNLSWTHYLLASFADSYNKGQKQFDSENRFRWLEKAHDNSWTTARLSAEIKKQKAIADTKDYFMYYTGYIAKVRNVLLHVEKDSLNDSEKDQLIHKLLDTYNEFMVYLKEK